MIRYPILNLVLLALMLMPNTAHAGNIDFYVSPQGNDAWSGKRSAPDRSGKDGPFATLERARDTIRALKKSASVNVTVYLRGGTYYRDRSFALTADDSGTTYCAYRNESVRIVGGKQLTHWSPVTDPAILARLAPAVRDRVRQTDLKAIGIADFGRINNGGQGRPGSPESMTLLCNDKAMTLARWPNDAWAKIIDTPAGQNGDRFTFDSDRPAHWKDLDDVWLYGYWTYDWADSYEKVTQILPEQKTFVTAPPLPVYGYTKGKRYFALNILEELDAPGEWYADRKTGLLYFYSPMPLVPGNPGEPTNVIATTVQEPLITLQDTAHITLQGLTLEAARGTGVQIIGGERNLVVGCVLRNLNRFGVTISGGKNNGVQSCDLYDLGEGGIALGGGDRKTLIPGGNFAINNHIHDFSRWFRTYRPGVALDGVGNIVSHNRIHDAPHSAIQGGGNEHRIEYNEIYRVCLETGDAGAFYMGRDFTQRGNRIQYNYFHHLRAGNLPGQEGFTDVMGVYLDDCLSGETVFGNIFYKAGRAMMIGGGRDNTVENNIFIDCAPSVHVDARGKGWASFWFNGKDPYLMNGLKDVNYDKPPYSTRYPGLADLLNDDPAMPKGNRILRNVVVGGRWLELQDNLNDKTVFFQDNFTEGDPRFVAPEKEDFRLKPDSPVWKLGFKPIPVEKIGLQKDAYRKTLPRRATGLPALK